MIDNLYWFFQIGIYGIRATSNILLLNSLNQDTLDLLLKNKLF